MPHCRARIRKGTDQASGESPGSWDEVGNIGKKLEKHGRTNIFMWKIKICFCRTIQKWWVFIGFPYLCERLQESTQHTGRPQNLEGGLDMFILAQILALPFGI
jgi:hypothetical protein